jgi:hypothetical protein
MLVVENEFDSGGDVSENVEGEQENEKQNGKRVATPAFRTNHFYQVTNISHLFYRIKNNHCYPQKQTT